VNAHTPKDGGDLEGYCPGDYGETVMWPDDLESQEVLVRSGL
jgi:hypothetical protein